MKIMTPETRVGILTIAAGIALIYLSVRTTGGVFWERGEHRTLYAVFNSVAGVEEKSKVRLSGVEIGYVDAITLEDSRAKVTFKVTHPGAVIRKDAVATIRTEGLLGEKYIEIIQGAPGAAAIGDGDTIARSEEAADISNMANKLSRAMDDVKAVTESLRNVFGTEEGENALRNILTNIDVASERLKVLLDENNNALERTVNNFAEISDEFAKTTPSLMDNLDRVAVALREVIEDNRKALSEGLSSLRDFSSEFAAILKENREGISTGVKNLGDASGEFYAILKENREQIKNAVASVESAAAKADEVMESIKGMSGSIERVAQKVERGEGTVGKLVTDEEVYDNLNNALVGANRLVNKTEDLRVYLGLRGERRPEMDDSKAYVTLKLRPRMDKEYILELSEDTRRTDLATTRNTLNSLLYTILVAKRYSDLTIRGGLIESSAGVGLDYHMLGESLVLTAEAFNLSGYDAGAPNAQVRAYLKWRFQKYLFLYAGGDELFNETYRTFLFGGGILFDDEDLKLALGLI